jgi:hypothetical protein
MTQFTKTTLFTDEGGCARFRDEPLELNEGSPAVRLSEILPANGLQLRNSPVGFRSQVHCTTTPQWVFILSGAMEIGLADGSTRVFNAGEHFYSADTLPENTAFDPARHGHWSRQTGDSPLVTLFVKE